MRDNNFGKHIMVIGGMSAGNLIAACDAVMEENKEADNIFLIRCQVPALEGIDTTMEIEKHHKRKGKGRHKNRWGIK